MCHYWEQNTIRRCRSLVLRLRVSLFGTVGAKARAPKLGNPGRGLHQLHGHSRHICSSARTPLGAALRLPCRPGYRMGLGDASGMYSRRQFERHVYRIHRPAVGRRWFYRQPFARPSCQGCLFGEARRTRSWHGCFRFFPRAAARDLSPAHFPAFPNGTLGLTVYSSA
jgi:hypothetical protein